MTFTKIIILVITLFSFSYFDINSLNSNDTIPPKVNIISPCNAEQYIVSRPIIKASFSDNVRINKSSVKLFLNYKDVTSDCSISEDIITYKPKFKLKRGSQIVKLQVKDINNNKTNLEWYFTVGSPSYNHYYGLLHSHTSNSDGHGTYEDAYYRTKLKSKLDFFAITEHSNMFDNDLNCNLKDGSKSKKWENLIRVSKQYNSDGSFLALRGFEMSYPYKDVSNPIGHINVFNSDGFVSSNDIRYSNLKDFYELISKEDKLIAQFNHPCDIFGRFNNFEYNKNADNIISLIEVCNGYNKEISKNKLSFDDYQKALDIGWHLAPSANQDNHRTDWGSANEFRTVVLCTDLNENSFYDSLKNMRVYATQDSNIKIDFTINDVIMGSTIKNTSNLYFNVSVIDKDVKDKIKKIEVVSNNGKVIASQDFNSNLSKLEFKLIELKNSFYYVKVYQNNNKVSVTAPIWIEFDKK